MNVLRLTFLLFSTFATFSLAGQTYSSPEPSTASSQGVEASETQPLIDPATKAEGQSNAKDGKPQGDDSASAGAPAQAGKEAEAVQQAQGNNLKQDPPKEENSFLMGSGALALGIMVLCSV